MGFAVVMAPALAVISHCLEEGKVIVTWMIKTQNSAFREGSSRIRDLHRFTDLVGRPRANSGYSCTRGISQNDGRGGIVRCPWVGKVTDGRM